jgi:hypothetical protein
VPTRVGGRPSASARSVGPGVRTLFLRVAARSRAVAVGLLPPRSRRGALYGRGCLLMCARAVFLERRTCTYDVLLHSVPVTWLLPTTREVT